MLRSSAPDTERRGGSTNAGSRHRGRHPSQLRPEMSVTLLASSPSRHSPPPSLLRHQSFVLSRRRCTASSHSRHGDEDSFVAGLGSGIREMGLLRYPVPRQSRCLAAAHGRKAKSRPSRAPPGLVLGCTGLATSARLQHTTKQQAGKRWQ